RHIEVMYRHIEEDAARNLNVFNRGGGRVTTDNMHQMWFADFAVYDGLLYAPVVRIESPVKPNLQLYASFFNRLKRCVDPAEVIINRFLAKDVFSGFRCFNNNIGMS